MVGRRMKAKYTAVETRQDDFDVDPVITKRKTINKQCIWNSLATAGLISIYFAPSICLTFYQRWFLQKFHFPLFTVIIHMIIKYLLAALLKSIFALKYGKTRLNIAWKEYIIGIAPTGVFSGIDIGFSNWGLELITVSLYSMTKSTSIIFILIFAILLKLEQKSWSLCVIVVMISTGLFLFTYKATQFDITGFMLVLFASMCSGLRWTCVQLMMQKAKMGMKNPIDMIYHMQPFMIISVLPFMLVIEGEKLITAIRGMSLEELKTIHVEILIGALIAFFMEITEVLVVSHTSSLTLSVAGIFKEIIILILAAAFNGDKISKINGIGLLVCLCGIMAHVFHKIRTIQMQLGTPKTFEFDASDHYYDMGKSLINNHEIDQMSVSTDSDGEHDSQVLFNILNRHDR